MDDLLETLDIVQIVDNTIDNIRDVVIREAPLTIFVNDQELVTLLCSPQNQKNLAIGFLYSEGFIAKKEDVYSLLYNESQGAIRVYLNLQNDVKENFAKGRTVTSGCARGLTFHQVFDKWQGSYITSKLAVSAKTIHKIANSLNEYSPAFKKTGCTHIAVLYQGENFLLAREDIGRHNAVDKVIGECFTKDIIGQDKILMMSGRVSSEILLKSAKWQIPILISRSAPTTAAIKLANEIGVTLIGFARGKRMNIYTNAWRIYGY